MQSNILNKFNKKNLCIFILFVMIYSISSLIPQFMNKVYAATYTYSKNEKNLPSDFTTKYPGYKELLQTLVEEHPNWIFNLRETGLDWETSLIAEYQGHGSSPKNLTQYNTQWICPICESKRYDNGTWKCTSYKAIAYMMDPRNSLNSSDVFQFQDLSSTVADEAAIRKMVSGTFINNEECINAIISASKKHNVSPYHLVSRILQEQGRNGSTLGLGVLSGGNYKISGQYAILEPAEKIATGKSVSKNGGTYTAITLGDVNKDGNIKASDYMLIKNHIMGNVNLDTNAKKAADVNEDGNIKASDYMAIKNHIMGKSSISVSGGVAQNKYYNLFNIGANGNTSSTIIANGLARAKAENWTSMSASIIGGAEFIAESYIAKGQSTLYYQKFNVTNKNSLYSHQYMQNVTAAQTEGENMRDAYSSYGILESEFVFDIPLYENMPATASAKPVPGTLSKTGFMKITASSLNLRTEPNTNSASKGYLDYGTVVKSIEDLGSWCKVLTPKGIGYMSKEYLLAY